MFLILFQKNMVFYHSPTEILSLQNIEKKILDLEEWLKKIPLLETKIAQKLGFL